MSGIDVVTFFILASCLAFLHGLLLNILITHLGMNIALAAISVVVGLAAGWTYMRFL